MAGCPLRPATRRRLGRPLPYQLADGPWAHPGAEACSRGLPFPGPLHGTGLYSVLPPLSEGYPHLQGRSPMSYSPVCHPTGGLLPFHVGLACVRHAASVRSEPGSNSPVEPGSNDPLRGRCGIVGRLAHSHDYSVFKDRRVKNPTGNKALSPSPPGEGPSALPRPSHVFYYKLPFSRVNPKNASSPFWDDIFFMTTLWYIFLPFLSNIPSSPTSSAQSFSSAEEILLPPQ